jgi:hypothetical protein
MTLLAAIGDISRFASARKLVGYAGLGAGIHQSAEMHHTGRITKQGRREVRRALVEAAWVAALRDTYWNREFDRLSRRMSEKQAIVAIAHKLLVAAWHVLAERSADKQADPELVASKLMIWSKRLGGELRGGLSVRQFAQYHLKRLSLEGAPAKIRKEKRLRSPASAAPLLDVGSELVVIS